eukprot:CAMPEP_0168283142 /NCGR_PEP_ID=MMETSP0141_2-20121125/22777_1 /TAXON_ID=44445 /ORGANISM="Pseudo-nitzschia australis, Strain 10249 10 AB" /LENGTH=78 /DNA_ID=CAMNT_0008226983 /DNA_START=668 /DNA_END=904 /DNA_ORIENTATION=+
MGAKAKCTAVIAGNAAVIAPTGLVSATTVDKCAAHHAAVKRENDLASAMETVASVRHQNQFLAQQQHALLACIDNFRE